MNCFTTHDFSPETRDVKASILASASHPLALALTHCGLGLKVLASALNSFSFSYGTQWRLLKE